MAQNSFLQETYSKNVHSEQYKHIGLSNRDFHTTFKSLDKWLKNLVSKIKILTF